MKASKQFKQYGILLLLIIISLTPAYTQLNHWQQTSGPYGGDIRGMMAADSGMLFVWTNSMNGLGKGELSVSTDAGRNWTLRNYPGRVIYTLYHYSSRRTLLATDEGLFRTDSGGVDWIPMSDSLPVSSNSYRLSEANGELFVAMYNKGLYKYSPPNNCWRLLNSDDTAFTFRRIMADTAGTLFAGGSFGVFASSDSGKTWISKNAGLEQTNHIVETMTFDKNGTLYVSFNSGGLYSSTDHGTTWKKRGTYGFFDGFIIHPSEEKFFAGFAGKVVVSTDSGATWNMVTGKNLGSNIRHLALDAGQVMYGATSRGTIYSSTDYGESWSSSGLSNKYISAIAVGANGNVYAGSIDNGLSMSSDSGKHWQAIHAGLPNPIGLNTLMAVSDNYLFAGANGGLYRTRLDTLHWELTGGGLQAYTITATAKINDTLLFAGFKHGVLCGSKDGGKTWKVLSILSGAIFDIVPRENGKMFAGGPGGIYISNDTGKTWSTKSMSSLLEGGYVEAMAVAPNGTLFAAGMDAVLRSTDEGNSWTRVLGSDGIRIPIDALIITQTGTVYTAWDSSYCSTDNGETWETAPLYSPNAYALSTDGLLYAGNWYGVFSTQPKVMGVNPPDNGALATTFALSQNYPNPFNPATTIRFTVPFKTFVTLAVFDIMGREVTRLVEEEKPSGTYQVTFHPKNLSSGIYFYRLESGAFRETKKLLLVK